MKNRIDTQTTGLSCESQMLDDTSILPHAHPPMQKVAVIGAGHWGQNIVRTLHAMGALGAVADADTRRLNQLAETYPDVALNENYIPLLASDYPAVLIATPAPTHYEVTKAALLAGKDVFVEKPITLKSSEAEELVQTAERNGRILMVGHLLLYQPAIQWIKRYLDSGELGSLHSLHQQRLNLGRAREVENVLWSLGVHDIAVTLYLIGSAPTSVCMSGQCALQPGIEDDFFVHLTFNGPDIRNPKSKFAHLHVSWLWYEKRRTLTLIGSRGMLVYDENSQQVTLHRKWIEPNLTQHDEGAEVIFEGSGEPLRLEMEHFLTCLANRQQPLSNGRSAVDVLKVLESVSLM